MEDRQFIKRRRVPRRTFLRSVGLLIGGEYRVERAYQLGEGGMMVSSTRPLRAGDRVVVSFKLPEKMISVVRGTVKSVVEAQGAEPVRYGIEFMSLDFQAKRMIRNYVASSSGQIADKAS